MRVGYPAIQRTNAENNRQVANTWIGSPPVEARARQPDVPPQEAVMDAYLETNKKSAGQQADTNGSLTNSSDGNVQAQGESHRCC